MGNCGFSLAPCAEKDKLLVMRNLERAEDIAPEAMEAGIKWSWETFPQYLDAVDRTPKGINYAAYMGHSALRTYVMGERAFTDEATPDDLDGDEARSARRDSRRRDRLHHLAHAQPSDPRRSAGREPPGQLGRGAATGRRDGRAERRGVRNRRRGHRTESRADSRLSRPPEGAGGGYRRAGHVRHFRQPQGARLLAPLLQAGRRDRRGRRAHVRADAGQAAAAS